MRFLILFATLLLVALPAAAAQLTFERGGFWLVNPVPAEIALRSDGVPTSRLALYRLSDPALLAQVLAARASRSLNEAELLRRVTTKLTPVWQADLTLDQGNTLPVPLLAAAPDNSGVLASGNYVLTAADGNGGAVAQWFAESALSLAVQFTGGQAFVAAFDRATRQPRGGTVLHWIGADGQGIGQAITLPDSGAALLDKPDGAALLLGSSGSETADPTAAADLDFIAVPPATAPAAPHALLYPSTQAVLVAAPGQAQPELKLGAGAPLASTALLPGLWLAPLPALAQPQPLTATAGTHILATASVGERTASKLLPVAWQQAPATIIGAKPAAVRLKLGAAFAGKSGLLQLQPAVQERPAAQPFTVDAKGLATVLLDPAALQLTTPGRYAMTVVVDGRSSAGRDLSIWPAQSWLELSPQFAENVVPENTAAGFSAQLREADGSARAVPVEWELAREAYSFEWYQADDGRWAYRTKAALTPVSNGTAAVQKGRVAFEVPVAAGRYRLTAKAGDQTATQSFTAGWWLAPVPAATPEAIDLAAQSETAADGTERIAVFVDPPFDARVWLAAASAGSAAPAQVADIPDQGGFVYIPRAALAPGQPLTLLAFAVPQDTGAPPATAEGMVSLPLGPTLSYAPETLNGAHATELTLSRLPVGGTVLATLVDQRDDAVEALLWQSAALPIAADGTVHLTLPAVPGKAMPLLRTFIAHTVEGADRLDIAEHGFPATTAVKSGLPRH